MLVRCLARRTFATGRLVRASDRGSDGPPSNSKISSSDFRNPWQVLKSEFEKDVDAIIPRSTDVLIIGGGAIGCSVAYWLKKAVNLDVTVVERDPVYTMSATCLSVGGLRQQFSEPENIRMSLFCANFIRNIQEHLSVLDCDPPTVDFCPHGYLTLASEKGAHQLQKNYEVQVENGAEVELLGPTQLKERWPWMNVDDISLGCFGVANEGWFDPYCLLKAVRRKALSLGVTFVHGDLTDFVTQEIGPAGDRIQLREAHVTTADGEVHPIHFSNIVNAAGPWAQEVAKLAGIGTGGPGGSLLLPVERRKRFVYIIKCPTLSQMTEITPMIINNDGVYVRKDSKDYYICGQSPEEDEEPSVDDLDVNYDFFDEHVWPSLAHRIPSMEAVKVLRAWAGFYDYNTVDQNLIIGNHPYFKNFFFCNGSSGHGIQHSLAIGRAISELILFSEFKTIDLSRLSFDRFLTGEHVMEKNII